MDNSGDFSVLVLCGGRFLGHAHPIVTLLAALRHRSKSDVRVESHVVPLNTGPVPPGAALLAKQSTILEVHEQHALPMDRSKPIRDYCDLHIAQGLCNLPRIVALTGFLRELVQSSKANLLVTDSLPGVPQIASQLGLPLIAMRSHGLRQRSDGGLWRDVFLDEGVNGDHVALHRDELHRFLGILGAKAPEGSDLHGVDALYYSGPTITPGFGGFDVCPKIATSHAFMRLGTLPERRTQRNSSKALVYVRDDSSRKLVRTALEAERIECLELDESDPNLVDLWNEEADASLIVSHGGHGMAASALYQRIPHLIVADNDDRYTNGRRVQAAGAGVLLDWRRAHPRSLTGLVEAMRTLPALEPSRLELDSVSQTASSIVERILGDSEIRKELIG